MTQKTRIGLLGAGFIGKIHAQNLASHEGVELKLISDTNAEVGQKVARDAGAAFEPDIEAVINDKDIDVIWIATSAGTHSDLIRKARAAGKAVFCEKPIATDIEDARALVKECADNALPIFVAFNRRFDATHRRLKEHVTNGDVGALEVVIITSRDPKPPPPDYVATTPGGVFYDTMIHDFDLAVWLLGERPVSIYAAASSLVEEELNPHRDMDTAAVTMRTESGKLCQINVSRRSVYGYDQRVEVLGSKGMVQSTNHKPNSVVVSGKTNISTDPLKNFFIDRYTQSYVNEIDSFLNVLQGGETDYPDLKAGYLALYLSMAALESAKTGKPVEIEI